MVIHLQLSRQQAKHAKRTPAVPMIGIPCAYSMSAYIYLAPSNDSPTVKACLERFATITRNLQLRD